MAVLALFSFRGCEGIDREWPIVRKKKRQCQRCAREDGVDWKIGSWKIATYITFMQNHSH